jgi:hypothetical protein
MFLKSQIAYHVEVPKQWSQVGTHIGSRVGDEVYKKPLAFCLLFRIGHLGDGMGHYFIQLVQNTVAILHIYFEIKHYFI